MMVSRIDQALPGVMGNRGLYLIYFRGSGEHKSKNEGNKGTREQM